MPPGDFVSETIVEVIRTPPSIDAAYLSAMTLPRSLPAIADDPIERTPQGCGIGCGQTVHTLNDAASRRSDSTPAALCRALAVDRTAADDVVPDPLDARVEAALYRRAPISGRGCSP